MKLPRLGSDGDDFLPSVTTLISGTTLAMGLAYLARPVLTRLYTPEMFGLLGVFSAMVAVLTTVSSGRYDDAIMLPEDDKKARSVLYLGLFILLGLTVLAIPVALFRGAIAGTVGKPELAPYLVVLPLSLLCTGLVRLAESWMTREKRFRAVATTRAAQSATAVPIQLVSGFRGPSPWGLIGGLVAGHVAAAIMLSGLTWRRLRNSALPTFAEIRASASRYRDFPLFSGPSALLNSLSSQLPAFLLYFFFDAGVVGHYAQAYALLAVPIGLVGSSVAQVYFEKAARCKLEGGLDDLTSRVYRRLLELGLFPMLVVLIAGPDLLEFVLGAEWRTAGDYSQWLAIWLLFTFVSSPLTRLFDVLERLRANLAFNALLFSSRAIVLIVAGILGSPVLAIALYGVASALIYLGLLTWLLMLAEVNLASAFAFFRRASIRAAGPLIAVGATVAYQAPPPIVFLVTCLAGVVYGIVLLVQHRRP